MSQLRNSRGPCGISLNPLGMFAKVVEQQWNTTQASAQVEARLWDLGCGFGPEKSGLHCEVLLERTGSTSGPS